jgi:hypothetical protein
MLTDEIAQVHRSPGFITSNLVGKRDDGTVIKGKLLSYHVMMLLDIQSVNLMKYELITSFVCETQCKFTQNV